MIEGIYAWDLKRFFIVFKCIILLLTIELTIYTKITLILRDVSGAIFTHVIHFNKVRGFNTTSNITGVFISILKQFYFCERLNFFFRVEFLFYFCYSVKLSIPSNQSTKQLLSIYLSWRYRMSVSCKASLTRTVNVSGTVLTDTLMDKQECIQ